MIGNTISEFPITFASVGPGTTLPVVAVMLQAAVTPRVRIVLRSLGAAAALVGGKWFDNVARGTPTAREQGEERTGGGEVAECCFHGGRRSG